MSEPAQPLYIWSAERPTPEQMEILKEAKRETGLDVLVRPFRAIAGCGRVLSLQGRPPFYCEWAETTWDDPKLSAKIKWVLTGEGGRPHTGLDWMQEMFGPETKEVGMESYTPKVGFN